LAFLRSSTLTGVSALVVLPLIALTVAAIATVLVLRALDRELGRLTAALHALADLPRQLAMLRAETEATGVSARLDPNP